MCMCKKCSDLITRNQSNALIFILNLNFAKNCQWKSIKPSWYRPSVWKIRLTGSFIIQRTCNEESSHYGEVIMGAITSNHQPHDCLLNRLFRCKSKKISKLRVTGLCAGNSPGTGEFPTQMDSNAENVSIWSSHHDLCGESAWLGASLFRGPVMRKVLSWDLIILYAFHLPLVLSWHL